MYSLFSKRFRRGFYDLIYRSKSCTYSFQSVPSKKSTINGNQNKERPEDVVRYIRRECNSSQDMVIVTNLRGAYNGKQIITRQALRRHFNFEVSSSKLSGSNVSDANYNNEGNCMFHKKKKLKRGISNYNGMNMNNSMKDDIILSHSCDLYPEENSSRFPNKQRSRIRRYFNKSEGDCANMVSIVRLPHVRPPLHNESEVSQNEPRSGVFSSSYRKRNCKYKVIFNNKTTSEASAIPVVNQDTIKKVCHSLTSTR